MKCYYVSGGKLNPVYALKTWASGGVVPIIFNLSVRWGELLAKKHRNCQCCNSANGVTFKGLSVKQKSNGSAAYVRIDLWPFAAQDSEPLRVVLEARASVYRLQNTAWPV